MSNLTINTMNTINRVRGIETLINQSTRYGVCRGRGLRVDNELMTSTMNRVRRLGARRMAGQLKIQLNNIQNACDSVLSCYYEVTSYYHNSTVSQITARAKGTESMGTRGEGRRGRVKLGWWGLLS